MVLGALRPAGLGDKAVMVGQFQEAGIEGDLAIAIMTNHRRLLVIHQHAGWNAIKVPEGLHQGLVGVFGVLARASPDVKVSGVTQHVHRDVDGTHPATDFGSDLPPVMLELLTRLRFVSNRLLAGSKGAFGLDVFTNQRRGTAVSLFPQLLENDLGVPDLIGQLLIDKGLERVQLAGSAMLGLACGRGRKRQVATHRAF